MENKIDPKNELKIVTIVVGRSKSLRPFVVSHYDQHQHVTTTIRTRSLRPTSTCHYDHS
jgi:hypothetical protein